MPKADEDGGSRPPLFHLRLSPSASRFPTVPHTRSSGLCSSSFAITGAMAPPSTSTMPRVRDALLRGVQVSAPLIAAQPAQPLAMKPVKEAPFRADLIRQAQRWQLWPNRRTPLLP